MTETILTVMLSPKFNEKGANVRIAIGNVQVLVVNKVVLLKQYVDSYMNDPLNDCKYT